VLPHILIHILLIEDSLADIALFREALKEVAIPRQLSVLKQTSEIEAFVALAKSAAATACPHMIILDYFLNRMEVAEILARVRSLPGYERVPVIL
jgi:CheY-like chemotaxis protein